MNETTPKIYEIQKYQKRKSCHTKNYNFWHKMVNNLRHGIVDVKTTTDALFVYGGCGVLYVSPLIFLYHTCVINVVHRLVTFSELIKQFSK
jgi:hypothetical protein